MYGFPKRLVGGGNCVRACNPGKCDPTQQRLLTGQALKTVVKSLGRTCNGDPTNSVSKSAPYISKGRVMLSTVFVFVYVCLFCVCVFFRQRFPSNEKHDTLRGLMFNLMETKSFSQSIRQQQVPSISSSSCSGFTMQRQCCLGIRGFAAASGRGLPPPVSPPAHSPHSQLLGRAPALPPLEVMTVTPTFPPFGEITTAS